MTASQETAPAPDGKWTDFSQWADSFSKLIAGIAIAVYASGFLIVSIYHSRYGFIGVSPFRPRVLAAGAWFCFFVLIPVSIAIIYKDISWTRVAQNSYGIWVACLGISFPLIYILFNTSDSLASSPSSPSKFWWVWVIAILVSLGIVLFIAQSKKVPPLVSATASVVLVIFFVQATVRELMFHEIVRLDTVSLWFFAVTLATIVELKIRSKQDLLVSANWAKPLISLFVALLVFAQYYYPHLKSSWGGGAPVEVTICFTKDSAISPSKTTSAQLIEEADEGFYIVGSKESRAVFIPRGSVAYIYFSSKVGDSQLLH